MPAPAGTTRLVETYLPEAWSYLRYLGCDGALADDLAQETFVTVFTKPFEERSPAETRAFLRETARFHFLTHWRKEKRRDELLRLEAAERVWRENIADGSGNAYAEALARCLERLDEQARRVIELRYREGKDVARVANELGLAEANVHTIAHRTKERLRACIKEKTIL
ncbi:MAG: RNA polymerase sigma factor [Planctomycetes bacterium]|nr:RNA polymerase sigma factor [Planctomycetota bacterium]NUQ34724.1 RNA polymerase sigma factor [Planctomycetaceae bacterium]